MAAPLSWTTGKQDPLMSPYYTKRELDVEEAEGAILEAIEGRRPENQRPYLPTEDEQQLYYAMHNEDDHHNNNKRKSRISFKQAASQLRDIDTAVEELKQARSSSRNLDELLRDDSKGQSPREGLLREEAQGLDHQLLYQKYSKETEKSTCQRCNPVAAVTRLCRALNVSLVLWGAIPLSIAAFVLYYHADDPDLDFLPGEAKLSWWFNFVARLCVTLELAFVSQWLLVDCIMLRTGLFSNPLVTLTFLQSKGWPFVLTSWSLLNLVFLQGDNPFQRHWLFWTKLALYNTEDGDYVLMSGIYVRLLLSGIIAGLCTALKRVFVALQFGGQQLHQFKPRLEKILADVVIIGDIGSLASQAQGLDDPEKKSGSLSLRETAKLRKRQGWPTVDFREAGFSEEDVHEESLGSHEMLDWDGPATASSGRIQEIKQLLDRWHEPINRRDKSRYPSIGEILRFRRALLHLDDTYPFGEEFGRSFTRDECILSSHNVFEKLSRFASSNKERSAEQLPPMSFDVFELIAVEEDGTEDTMKKDAVRKLFRPNSANEVSLFAFVQSCDSVYKRLRYFRASLSNASVISDVLEQIINGIFCVVLVLLLLSVMQVNPWTLLVSMTSLLVSLSFALGSSVSRYVEGALLIAVRRPFDLGDRIFMSSADSLNPEPNITSKSWFVEDIGLTTTTLRYSRTNEVSTVNNSDLAGLRIVNCNLSSLATVFLEMNMHMSIFEDDNLEQFRCILEKYVADRPRRWDSVSFCRHDDFDADNEMVKFAISVRHCSSWQDASRIKMHRADLVRFLYETSKNLSIHYEAPVAQQVFYNGGLLKEGEIKQGYKRDLLSSTNIRSGIHNLPFDASGQERIDEPPTSASSGDPVQETERKICFKEDEGK